MEEKTLDDGQYGSEEQQETKGFGDTESTECGWMQGILGLSDLGDYCREGGPRVEASFDVDGARPRLANERIFQGKRVECPCKRLHGLPRRLKIFKACARNSPSNPLSFFVDGTIGWVEKARSFQSTRRFDADWFTADFSNSRNFHSIRLLGFRVENNIIERDESLVWHTSFNSNCSMRWAYCLPKKYFIMFKVEISVTSPAALASGENAPHHIVWSAWHSWVMPLSGRLYCACFCWRQWHHDRQIEEAWSFRSMHVLSKSAKGIISSSSVWTLELFFDMFRSLPVLETSIFGFYGLGFIKRSLTGVCSD